MLATQTGTARITQQQGVDQQSEEQEFGRTALRAESAATDPLLGTLLGDLTIAESSKRHA